jgi:hypothetical protein
MWAISLFRRRLLLQRGDLAGMYTAFSGRRAGFRAGRLLAPFGASWNVRF